MDFISVSHSNAWPGRLVLLYTVNFEYHISNLKIIIIKQNKSRYFQITEWYFSHVIIVKLLLLFLVGNDKMS